MNKEKLILTISIVTDLILIFVGIFGTHSYINGLFLGLGTYSLLTTLVDEINAKGL